MKNKRPNIKIPSEKIKDIKGFEEMLEIMDDDDLKKIIKRGSEERKIDPNDLTEFLSIEEERLKKLDQFFKQKIQNITKPELVSSLVSAQKKELDRTKAELLSQVTPIDSIPNMYLAKLFNSAFSVKKPE